MGARNTAKALEAGKEENRRSEDQMDSAMGGLAMSPAVGGPTMSDPTASPAMGLVVGDPAMGSARRESQPRSTAGEAETAARAGGQTESARAAAAGSEGEAAPAAASERAGMHQVGLGVDIVEIARMAAVLHRTPRFRSRVFTDDEQAYCNKMATPEIHYATRFAAKEAVLKALGTGFGWGKCDPRDVEVRRSSKGRPFVVLHGAVREIARAQLVTEIPLSLSYTHTEAVACAMAITREAAAPAPQEDPMAQLSRQFKELRSLLDDMDEGASASVGNAAGETGTAVLGQHGE